VKIGPVYPEIFDEIRRTTMSKRNAISISRFSAETTGPIFTKFLHNILTLVALLNLAHTRRYLIPFLNTTVTKVESLPIFAQNRLPWQRPLRCRKKTGPDRSSTPKKLSFDIKIAKIGPADLQIICLREIIKTRKKLRTVKYIALPATLPSGQKYDYHSLSTVVIYSSFRLY